MNQRAPIVVVMGHIDHGKSTLLDQIRQTNVAAGEVGGITQAINAYQVNLPTQAGGMTFLDTPGHEAFARMRERGATIADLAILVISAEEGVKAQTLEALADILVAKLPFIVAINKIDRPNANPDLIKQQLAENNVLLEGYGGEVPVAKISAKTGAGVPELLELLSLLAELQNLTADPTAPASGYILEADVNPRAGVSATLIVKDGTLHQGDFLVSGRAISKIRRLNNFRGELMKGLPAGAPAQVVGLTELPVVGSSFRAFSDKTAAEQNAAAQENLRSDLIDPRTLLKTTPQGESLETSENQVEISVFLKADVAGALEALEHQVEKLNTEQIRLKIIGRSVGKINENDVKLAGALPGALVLGFNIESEKGASDLAERLGLKIATFNIIYKLTEWLAEELKTRLPQPEQLTTLGRAKLLKIFNAEKDRQVVGGVVLEGKISAGKMIKVLRRENEIVRGKIIELQQQKLPAKEVEKDRQFGALVDAKVPLAIGDVLEVYAAT